MMQYIESNELREVLIELDQYHLNDEPYEKKRNRGLYSNY